MITLPNLLSNNTAWGTRAWFACDIQDFHNLQTTAIIGKLVSNAGLEINPETTRSWEIEIKFLRAWLVDISGAVFLGHNIPRMGRRADAVLLINDLVIVIEFKAGETRFLRADSDQVWDYALDLKNFHAASHDRVILPILVATEASSTTQALMQAPAHDDVYQPVHACIDDMPEILRCAVQRHGRVVTDPAEWVRSPYKPSPTIIEAARALYADHSVEAIARFDADASNLTKTAQAIQDIIHDAQLNRRKSICFVTGVPGAGKTLVGLNTATQRPTISNASHAVFLSGNGPLVAVLREALARDQVARDKIAGRKTTKSRHLSSIKVFIQNVHHFRDEALHDKVSPPAEHVAIFDEAQRAWNLDQTANFMRRKKGQLDFDKSEPSFLVDYLDRHQDWAVIVCLVGGGQEINIGEAGIREWIQSLQVRPQWHINISSQLTDREYGVTPSDLEGALSTRTTTDERLHLTMSLRSFRSDQVSNFVKALLDLNRTQAMQLLNSFLARYPIQLTRNLTAAKEWVRLRARGSERIGLMASSKAQRLKPHAIDVRINVDPVHWFLNPREDTRSSFYLEDAATEFQVQGLELDWAVVTWDADLRLAGDQWSYHDFRGSKWTNIHSVDNRRYLTNAYRVLLTRSRQGMVIFVPPGDPNDPTRNPAYYQATYTYLRSLGIPEITT